MSQIFTNGLGVAQINHDIAHIVNLGACERHKHPTASLIKHFSDVPHKWSILLCCFCEDDSQQYLKTEQINLASAYSHRDLVTFLRDAHNALAESCNQGHLIGLGWLASTDDVDFNLKNAENLFEQLGAWEYV
jgi:hypothetical protein